MMAGLGNYGWRGWLVVGLVVFLGLYVLVGAGGCAEEDRLSQRDFVGMLRAGEARGHLTMVSGGSPTSAGMKQVFFLGPENASFAFDGDIDFAKVAEYERELRGELEYPADEGGAGPGGGG